MQQTVLLGGGGCLYDQSCVNEFRTVDNYMCLQGLFQGLSLKAKAGTKDLSPVLKESLQRRVDYKLACFVFSSFSGHAPPYLADDIHLVSESHRRRLRSSTVRSCAVPHTHTQQHIRRQELRCRRATCLEQSSGPLARRGHYTRQFQA